MSEKYEEFVNRLEAANPAMFTHKYGGIAVGEGWWPIVEKLCGQIDAYTNWRNNTRESLLKANPYNHTIPEAVPQVTVEQIKEKFGGLRFYYTGGDDFIHGLVTMAEIWAGASCEDCGAPGKQGGNGWISTLCPTHRAERDAKRAEYMKSNGLEE